MFLTVDKVQTAKEILFSSPNFGLQSQTRLFYITNKNTCNHHQVVLRNDFLEKYSFEKSIRRFEILFDKKEDSYNFYFILIWKNFREV